MDRNNTIMKIYLVINTGNCPGQVQACFKSLKHAETFADNYNADPNVEHDSVGVEWRTVLEAAQPANVDYVE